MPDQPTRTDSPVVPAQRTPESPGPDPETQQKLADLRALKEAKQQIEIQQRLGELRAEGHGPQRHHDPTDQQLTDRLGNPVLDQNTGDPVLRPDGHVRSRDHVDPMTGTTTDAVTGGAHYCGPISSRIDSGADYVTAERYLKQRVPESGFATASAPISDILGPKGHERITGVHHDPAQPGQVKNVNFEGGTIKALYERESDGSLTLKSMFANPRHPYQP